MRVTVSSTSARGRGPAPATSLRVEAPLSEAEQRAERMTGIPFIATNPMVQDGEPIIAGTRTTVRSVAQALRDGLRAEKIQERLPHLSQVQIFAALLAYHVAPASFALAEPTKPPVNPRPAPPEWLIRHLQIDKGEPRLVFCEACAGKGDKQFLFTMVDGCGFYPVSRGQADGQPRRQWLCSKSFTAVCEHGHVTELLEGKVTCNVRNYA